MTRCRGWSEDRAPSSAGRASCACTQRVRGLARAHKPLQEPTSAIARPGGARQARKQKPHHLLQAEWGVGLYTSSDRHPRPLPIPLQFGEEPPEELPGMEVDAAGDVHFTPLTASERRRLLSMMFDFDFEGAAELPGQEEGVKEEQL